MAERAPAGGGTAPRAGFRYAALLGIAAVAATLAPAELLARLAIWGGFANPPASPFDSLGAAFITITPEWLKEIGIELFGQSDKVALAVAMVVTLLLVGTAIGLLGRLREQAAIALATAMVVVCAASILTRPGAAATDLAPLVVASIVGITLLHKGFRATDRPRYDAIQGPGPRQPTMPMDRRSAIRVAGIGALIAAGAGGLAELIPGAVDVQANRASVRLPPVAAAPKGVAAPASSGVVAGTATGTAAAGSAGTPRLQSANIVIPPAVPYGVDPGIPGLTPFVTKDADFYRVDTAFTLPRVTTDAWRLTVHGMVRNPFEITWAELTALPQLERWITLMCVSNNVGGPLVGNAAWQGVRLADLLARADPLPGADCVFSTSADGFSVTTPLATVMDGRDALLAIGMNGAPLPIEHGFPARLVVPGLYGYVSATKWVVDLNVTTFAAGAAYWTERGWSDRAPIKMSSRIDTPRYSASLAPGTIVVAGVAWAQHVGISAVEVQVDDGPWAPARRYPTASVDTWVQWSYRWDAATAAPGGHTLRCRAYDNTGAVQVAAAVRPIPDGASGYHEVPVSID